MTVRAYVRPAEATAAVEMFPGVKRTTIVSGDSITLVRVEVAAGAEVPEHTHPHDQAGTVMRGRVRIRLGTGDEAATTEVAAGGGYMIPGDLPHFVEALEDSTLVEVFSPEREEFAHD